MNHLHWWSPEEGATVRFGRMLGEALIPPAWIGLIGPLGTGKTRLVQGLARGAGYSGRVRSPSFVLEHRYAGRHELLHLDLYRLEEAPEDLEAVWEEDDHSIVVVEWADRVAEPPSRAIWIELHGGGEDGRWIHMRWEGECGLRDLRLERGRPDV